MRLTCFALVAVALGGCGDDDGPGDSGSRDSGGSDSAMVDTGTGTDTGTDTGTVDAGDDAQLDTGPVDATTDTAVADTGADSAVDAVDLCAEITLGDSCRGDGDCGLSGDYTCQGVGGTRRCAPASRRPTCGGLIGTPCTTRVFPECLSEDRILDGIGLCVSTQEEICVCAAHSDIFVCDTIRPGL